MPNLLLTLIAIVCANSQTIGEDANKQEWFKIRVDARDRERIQTPVRFVGITDNYAIGPGSIKLVDQHGNKILGQLRELPLIRRRVQFELSFVIPRLEKNQSVTYSVSRADKSPTPMRFRWSYEFSPGDPPSLKPAVLKFGDKPIMKYMCEKLDESTPENRERTYKVYHHVYSPDGKQLLTKGPGGLYSHHRGIFFGYNRITINDKKSADTWHCNQGESQIHQEMLSTYDGSLSAGHTAQIQWNDRQSNPFAIENRQIRCMRMNEALVIDFASTLTPVNFGPNKNCYIEFEGDPQHAGVQFRASQDVAENTRKQTYYIRPDGKDVPGNFRNWSNKKDETPQNKNHVDLPWHAMSFVVEGRRFTCCYLDHPTNPAQLRHSERDYGRFGGYFPYMIDSRTRRLTVKYRYVIVPGELTPEQIERFSIDYAYPPMVEMVEE